MTTEIQRKLMAAGQFAGAHGLEGLMNADAFWEEQPYGTRLYYGSGGTDYLHRSVLRTVVRLLTAESSPPAHPEGNSDE